MILGKATFEINNGIYNLTDDNLDNFFEFAKSTQSTVILKIYAEYCGVCKSLSPKYIKAYEIVTQEKEMNVLFAEIEGKEHPNVLERYNAVGFPSIYIFTPKKNYEPVLYKNYNDLSTNALIMALRMEILSPILLKDYSEFLKKYKNMDAPFLIYLQTGKSQNEFLPKVMNLFPNLKTYYTTNYKKFAEEFNIKILNIDSKFKLDANMNSVGNKGIGFNVINNDPLVLVKNPKLYEKPKTVDYDEGSDLKKFIIDNYFSSVEYCNNITSYIIEQRNRPNGILYIDFNNILSENLDKILLSMSGITAQFSDKIDFCIKDVDYNRKSIKSMNLDLEGSFYIWANKRKYRYREEIIINSTLQSNELKNFIAKFLKGEIKNYRKSTEIFEDMKSEPVRHLNGEEYDEVVNDPTKDVYVRIYDKLLQRKDQSYLNMRSWFNLSKEYVNSSNILISEIEITDNDVPEEIEPTVDPLSTTLAYLKNNKSHPIEYKGVKDSVDSLRSWVKSLSGENKKNVKNTDL